MAEAIIKGCLDNKVASAAEINASDPSITRREHLSEKFGISVYDNNEQAIKGANIVILATKPQHLDELSQELAGKSLVTRQSFQFSQGLKFTR